jgi:ubiquinone/menaquinone biosynthesis C-methylase UbiE
VTPAEAYEDYRVPAVFEPWSRELIQRAKVWNGDRVLDVACGTGIVARRIAGTGAQVTGLDADADMLAVARRRAADENVRVTYVEGKAEAMRKFTAASFDLVTCQQGIQFFDDRAAGVREMRRVIAPGGRVVVSCWCPLDRHPAVAALDAVVRHHFGSGIDAAYSLGDPATLRGLLAKAGFAAIAIDTVTRPAKFPSPARFIELGLTSIAAVFPALRALPDDERLARIAAATPDATAAIAPFVDGDTVAFAMSSLVAVGRVTGGS